MSVADPQAPRSPSMSSNAVVMVGGNVFVSVVLLAIDWVFIRAYGTALHGQVMWAVAVVTMAALLSDLGVSEPAGVRRIARLRASGDRAALREAIGELPVLSITMTLAATVALAGVALLEGNPQRRMWLLSIVVWVPALGLIRVWRFLFFGFERFMGAVVMHAIDEGGRLAGLLVCLVAGWGAGAVLGVWTLAHGVAIGAGWVLVRRLLGGEIAGAEPRMMRPREAGGMAARSVSYFAPTLWMASLPFLMVLVVGHWHEGTPLSVFKVCFSWGLVSRIIVLPLTNVLLPRLSWHSARAAEGAQGGDVLATSGVAPVVRLQGLVLTGAFALACALGRPFLALYSDAHGSAVAVLLVLTLAVGIDDYAQIVTQALMAGRHVRTVALCEAAKFIALIALGCLLVPGGAGLGAAWALAGAAALGASGKLMAVRRDAWRLGIAVFARALLLIGALGGVYRYAGSAVEAAWIYGAVWVAGVAILGLLRRADLHDWAGAMRRAFAQRRA